MPLAGSVRYEHNSSDLLKGGLVVKAVFPDGATSCTVPVDTLHADDLVIPITQGKLTDGSLLQEDFAARATGIPGTITIIRVDQWQNAADQPFCLLIIRKGMGRHLSPGTPNPKLLYNHPQGGMYAYLVTTVAGAFQDVTIPGIQLLPYDIIHTFKLTRVTEQHVCEVIGRRRPTILTADTFRLAHLDVSNLMDGEQVVVLIFKNQTYQVSAGVLEKFGKIGRPFGPMDLSALSQAADPP